MTRAWLVVLLVGAVTVAIKSAGPLFFGGRQMPPALVPVLRLLPPALFAALIATQVFATGHALTIDARLAGLLAAVLATVFHVRPGLILLAACVATAAARAFA
jgi:branched-subunit amino acid transport protein